VEKDANSLVILLMALGMHDQDSAVKASAPRLTELAEELAASSKDQAKAKAAYDAMVQAMANGATGGKPLAWEKRFVLGSLMKQVSTVNTRLKLYTRDESRFARSRETLGGFAALLAVVGQAAHADTHEVKDPAKIGDWYKYASEMRDAAGAVGEAIANNDFAAVQSSMELRGVPRPVPPRPGNDNDRRVGVGKGPGDYRPPIIPLTQTLRLLRCLLVDRVGRVASVMRESQAMPQADWTNQVSSGGWSNG
jgi:hypothetical protein